MNSPEALSRRQIIASLAIASLSGCSTNDLKDKTTALNQTQTARAETTSKIKNSSICEEKQRIGTTDPKKCCDFGKWFHTGFSKTGSWKITVSDIDIIKTFKLDESDERYKAKNGEKIVIIVTKIQNTASSSNTWEPSEQFVILLSDGTVLEPQGGYQHPSISSPIDIDDLQKIEHAEQYLAEGGSVKPNEIRRFWWLVPIPEEISRKEISIAFAPNENTDTNTACWKV